MMFGKERYSLLIEWFVIFIKCIRMIRGDSGSIYESIMVNTVSFLPKTALQFDTKYQILVTLSTQEVGY